MIRLQKVLADRGVASRRHAEELIRAGRVRVEGQIITTLGTKVGPDARIDVDDVPTRAAAPRYIALNKPKGIVSTASDERGRKTVVDLIGVDERLYPVGRLDAESEGLMLLTNDGEWAERVLHPRYGHEREYEVTVFGEITSVAMDQLRRGVRLEEGTARAERVDVLTRSRNASRLRVVLRTGWKRQLRRMLAAVDLRTDRLVRIRIGSLPLGRLKVGDWRELSPNEIADLAKPAVRPAKDVRSATGAAPKPSLLRGGEPPRSRSAVRRAPRRSAATGSPAPRGPSAQRPGRTGSGTSRPREAPRAPSPQRPTARSGRALARPRLANRRPGERRAPRAFAR